MAETSLVPQMKDLNVEETEINKRYLQLLFKRVENRDRAFAAAIQEVILAVMPAGKGSLHPSYKNYIGDGKKKLLEQVVVVLDFKMRRTDKRTFCPLSRELKNLRHSKARNRQSCLITGDFTFVDQRLKKACRRRVEVPDDDAQVQDNVLNNSAGEGPSSAGVAQLQKKLQLKQIQDPASQQLTWDKPPLGTPHWLMAFSI